MIICGLEFVFSIVVLYEGIPGNDNALRLSKTNKNKEKPTKQGGFTNKNLFFLVRFCFYLFLKDAERMLFCRRKKQALRLRM